MIHVSRLHLLMEQKDAYGKRAPFAMKFVKAGTGEVVKVKQAVMTSSYEGNRTYNIKFLPSGQIRKIRQLSIIEFNQEKVYV